MKNIFYFYYHSTRVDLAHGKYLGEDCKLNFAPQFF